MAWRFRDPYAAGDDRLIYALAKDPRASAATSSDRLFRRSYMVSTMPSMTARWLNEARTRSNRLGKLAQALQREELALQGD